MGRARTLLAVLLLAGCGALLLLACGDGGPIDAGEGGVATGGLPSCANPLALTGPDDGTLVRVDLDTSDGREGPVELFDCGPTDSSPPQAVIAYTVPGTGPHSVIVSTANIDTDRTFDSVLAIRRFACDGSLFDIRQTCFDDRGTDRRARGSILADGGETVWIIVTGYPGTGFVDRGPITVTVASRPDHPPTLESGSVLVTPTGVLVEVSGTDVDADGQGVFASFLGPAQELVDADGDGDSDFNDFLRADFNRSVEGATRFRETATFELPAGDVGGATEAWLTLYDEAGLESVVDLAVPVLVGDVVGNGDPCSPTQVCGRELECRTATCQATAERAAACVAATPIPIPVPTTMATSGMASTVLTTGDGIFSGDCASTVGREALYTVTVPTGRFDVIATTDTAGTAMGVDTVIYARTVCVDPASAPMDSCHDDIDVTDNRRSRVELLDLGGTDLTFFVEHYGGVPPEITARIELLVTLRPVLTAGMSCDPIGAMNRCEGDPCPASTRVCP